MAVYKAGIRGGTCHAPASLQRAATAPPSESTSTYLVRVRVTVRERVRVRVRARVRVRVRVSDRVSDVDTPVAMAAQRDRIAEADRPSIALHQFGRQRALVRVRVRDGIRD